MTMKLCPFLVGAALALGLAAPAFAWDLADTDEPGSVLVFPAVFTGSVMTVDQGLVPRTRFEISVTCPKGADCSNITAVNLRAHWVCGGDARNICAEVDFNPRFVAERLIDESAAVMGQTAENLHDAFPDLTREAADRYAAASQAKAAAAWADPDGVFAHTVVPMSVHTSAERMPVCGVRYLM